MPKGPYEKAEEAARFITSRTTGRSSRLAIVLGSGLSGVADAIDDRLEIPYSEIPYFLTPTVAGHDGRLVIGSCGGVAVAIMKGRFHFYEGYSLEEITLPVRTFAVMGIRSLVLTNAAGSLSPQMAPGSLMLITDHLNLMGGSPLRGPNDDRFGPRFPDMTYVYTPEYIDHAHQAARAAGISLFEGIYAGLHGPTYETPAEVRMLKMLGADAVGMSTVPEATVAHHCGMKLLAISVITNAAAGLTQQPIEHQDVVRVGREAEQRLVSLFARLAPKL